MGVFFLFLLALTVGCLTTVYWVPGEDLGRGYFQMNALVVLGLLGLAVAAWLLAPQRPFGEHRLVGSVALTTALVGAFLYYAAIWRQRWGLALVPATLALVASASALLAAGLALAPSATPLPHRQLLLGLNLGAAALLLGWSLVTMLLGHWYLIVPGLRFKHLRVFCTVLVAVVVLRALAGGASVAVAATVDPMLEPHPLRVLTHFEGQGMFFWFRLLWGLAIPFLLALMSLNCARSRSNQSATGILYVLVVGSLIGEITALYLTLTAGVPV